MPDVQLIDKFTISKFYEFYQAIIAIEIATLLARSHAIKFAFKGLIRGL